MSASAKFLFDVDFAAESDIAPGDCRIEWADGGLDRDRARAEAAIAEAVENYLAVRRDSES